MRACLWHQITNRNTHFGFKAPSCNSCQLACLANINILKIMLYFSLGDNVVFAKAPMSNASAEMTFPVIVKLYAIARRTATK